MSALKPFVSFLTRKKIPRTIAVLLVYLMFVGLFIAIIVAVLPPVIKESAALFKSFPFIIQNIFPSIDIYNFDLAQQIPNLTNQFVNLITSIFSNTIFFISTLFFGFYFLLQENILKDILIKFFTENETNQVVDIVLKAEKRMNAWFWGELILMIIVGVMSFVGLSLIGIKYALPLSILAGLLEAVPNLGPTIAAIPTVLIGFSESYLLGLAALALAFIVQQLENNLIVPIVMKQAVGLNPVVILIALIVGGKLAGVLGILLAIPLTLFVGTILVEVMKTRKTAINLR
jgi:predicted PurR-regulated permease PerM